MFNLSNTLSLPVSRSFPVALHVILLYFTFRYFKKYALGYLTIYHKSYVKD